MTERLAAAWQPDGAPFSRKAVLSKALDMMLELDRSGRLAPRYKFMIKFLRERLAKAR